MKSFTQALISTHSTFGIVFKKNLLILKRKDKKNYAKSHNVQRAKHTYFLLVSAHSSDIRKQDTVHEWCSTEICLQYHGGDGQ